MNGRNDFTKRLKILLDTQLKIILLEHDFVGNTNWLLEYQNFFATLLIF